MKAPALPLSSPAALIATWFGAGRLPLMPGTWGSLAALPAAALLQWLGGPLLLAAATVVLFGLGWWAADQYVRAAQVFDPTDVVVDEVIGQWIALLAAPLSVEAYALTLVLFRSFDVLKPPPIDWIERRAPGAWGVLLDDVVAGVIAGVIMLIVRWIAGD